MKKKVFYLIIILISIFISFTANNTFPDKQAKKIIDASAYYAAEFKTGRIIVQYQSTSRLSAASTVKLVTAMAASSVLKLTDIITINKAATKVEKSKAGFRTGEKYSFADLLDALLVKSANDAAVAIAVHISGNEQKFVQKMNQWCRQNKILSTHFSDSAGLSPDSYTTAEDLSKIFSFFLRDQYLFSVLSKTHAKINSLSGRKISFKSTNLLNRFFEGTEISIIGKTGFTKKARFCFTGIADIDNKKYLISIIGAKHNWRQLYELISYCENN